MRLIDAEALKAKWYKINDIDETDRGARFVGYDIYTKSAKAVMMNETTTRQDTPHRYRTCRR